MKLFNPKSESLKKKLGQWLHVHQIAVHNNRAAKRFRQIDNAEPRTRTILEKGSDFR